MGSSSGPCRKTRPGSTGPSLPHSLGQPGMAWDGVRFRVHDREWRRRGRCAHPTLRHQVQGRLSMQPSRWGGGSCRHLAGGGVGCGVQNVSGTLHSQRATPHSSHPEKPSWEGVQSSAVPEGRSLPAQGTERVLNKQIKVWCWKAESLGEVTQLRVELAGNFSKDQAVGRGTLWVGHDS